MTQQNHVCCFKKGGACLSLHKILPLAEALFFKLWKNYCIFLVAKLHECSLSLSFKSQDSSIYF